MKRFVVVNSYENVKEGLITRGHETAGRAPRQYIKVASREQWNFSHVDYSKSWAFIRKLAYKSLHLYGTGMSNIEDIVIEDVEKMCSLISGELGKPVPIHQYLGKGI